MTTQRRAANRPKRASESKRRKQATTSGLWSDILRIAKDIPEEDLKKMSTDGAQYFDEYLEGSRAWP